MSPYNKNVLNQLDSKLQNFKENLDLYEADVSKLSCNYHLFFDSLKKHVMNMY